MYSMNVFSSFYILTIVCNCMLVSTSILTSFKDDDRLRIFNEPPNEFEYVLKRHSLNIPEGPDSKERRSNMGSSFIRFGRSEPEIDLQGDLGGEANSKVHRQPRWKSPDVIIRFGRSDFKTTDTGRIYEGGRNDLSFTRWSKFVNV